MEKLRATVPMSVRSLMSMPSGAAVPTAEQGEMSVCVREQPPPSFSFLFYYQTATDCFIYYAYKVIAIIIMWCLTLLFDMIKCEQLILILIILLF